jgi:hypothetical protein
MGKGQKCDEGNQNKQPARKRPPNAEKREEENKESKQGQESRQEARS